MSGRGQRRQRIDLRLVCALAALLMLAVAAMLPPVSYVWFLQLHLPTDNDLLRHALNPDTAVLMMAAGWLLVCVEFCQPGTYFSGAVGMVAMSLGGYAMFELMAARMVHRIHFVAVIGVLVAAALTVALLRVAWLARRMKFRLESKPAGDVNVYPKGRTAGNSEGYSSTAKPAE
jgi:hypothetical protein